MLFITSTSNIIQSMLRLVSFEIIMALPAIEPAVKPGEILKEMLLIPVVHQRHESGQHAGMSIYSHRNKQRHYASGERRKELSVGSLNSCKDNNNCGT